MSTRAISRYPEESFVRVMLRLACVCAILAGCPRAAPRVLPAITSDDPAASAEMEEARRAEETGDSAQAIRRYEDFLAHRPSDPLAAVARLRLGKLKLAEGELEAARLHFDSLRDHPDEVLAERARFYDGVALHLQGDHASAANALRPLRGRTIDPEETTLLYRTLGAAYEQLGERTEATLAYDALIAEPTAEEAKDEARARVGALVRGADAEELESMLEVSDEQGYAFPLIAVRALRLAFERGDLSRVRALAERLEGAEVELDAELRAMTLRAERTGRVDARALGAILPLSGRGREVGQLSLWAMMMGAGLPLEGPPGADTPRIVFRDSAGDPERAAAAVSDLVTLHQVAAIVGPPSVQASRAAAARAAQLGVPFIALAPDAEVEGLGDNVFRLMPTIAEECSALVRASGHSRFAVLRPSHGFGARATDAFLAAVEGSGGSVVEVVEYENPTNLRQAVESLASLDFESVFVPDSADALSLVAPALAAVGLRGGERNVGLLLPSVAFSERAVRRAGRYLQGARVVRAFDRSRSNEAEAFVSAFEQQHGETPGLFAAAAYDASRWLLATALASRTNNSANREAITQSLRGGSFDGVTTLSAFNLGGAPVRVGVGVLTGDALEFPDSP